MSKKVESDLEKMNKDRRRAEEEYLASQEKMLNTHRIIKEGIMSPQDLIDYLEFGVMDARAMEDKGRATNNLIMYSEAIAVRREFGKVLNLLYRGGEKLKMEAENGGEITHREKNGGMEGYV